MEKFGPLAEANPYEMTSSLYRKLSRVALSTTASGGERLRYGDNRPFYGDIWIASRSSSILYIESWIPYIENRLAGGPDGLPIWSLGQSNGGNGRREEKVGRKAE
jgi:hypothetical protein